MPLPPAIAALSADGNIHGVGACGGQVVLFIPSFIPIPDGALGWLHTVCPERNGEQLESHGDPVVPEVDLGHGWWWAG